MFDFVCFLTSPPLLGAILVVILIHYYTDRLIDIHRSLAPNQLVYGARKPNYFIYGHHQLKRDNLDSILNATFPRPAVGSGRRKQ